MSEDAPPPAEADAGAGDEQAAAETPPDNGDEGGLLIEVDTSETPAARIESLEAALTKAEQEKKDHWDKFLRATADLENFRRRARRDLDDARADAKSRVLKEMLPVVDNLERAVAHADGDVPGESGAVLEGVRLVLRQFLHAFERCDVRPVEADGQPFDPNFHEAISQQDSDAPPGTVINVLQKGYRLGDRLLRPSLVVVARARAAPAGDAGDASSGDSGGDGPAPDQN